MRWIGGRQSDHVEDRRGMTVSGGFETGDPGQCNTFKQSSLCLPIPEPDNGKEVKMVQKRRCGRMS
jgi:hypothetical protein